MNELNKTGEFESSANHSQQKMNFNDKHVQDIIKMMNDDLNLEKLEDKDGSLRNELESQNGSRIGNSPNLDENFYSDEKSESNTEIYNTSTTNNNNKTVEDINEQAPSDSGCSSEMDNYKKPEHLNEEKISLPIDKENGNFFCENAEDIDEKEVDDDDDDDDDESETDPDIIEFIAKAKEFEANALDLSKKNLKKIPKQLYELDNLQYIYLEGNQISKLPKRFFQIFKQLKWLDLRNNQLKELPVSGLSKHEHLRYILLENNRLRHLPNEIAYLRHLTALSLSDNPLSYPPCEVVQKGCKEVQQYLRNEIIKEQIRTINENNENLRNLINESEDDYYDIQSIADDIWASDNEENQLMNSRNNVKLFRSKSATRQMNSSVESYIRENEHRIKSATKNLLITRSMRANDAEEQNLALKERLNRAKLSANKLRRVPLPPTDLTVFKNEALEKAIQNGKVDKYKKTKEKIDAKLQKINDKIVVDDFREKLKTDKRKMLNKRLVKGVDFVEAARKAPFDINEDHMIVMNNKDREFVDRRLTEERMRRLSPDTLWRIEEERRIRDNVLQEKIREYTNKLLNRRNNKSLNPKQDRVQAARDLRELKQIQKELEQRKFELQHNFRNYTGDLIYKEISKKNAQVSVENILKHK